MIDGVGANIGPYRIDRELGRGGMGVVYMAHDTRLDRRVAMKALPGHLATDPERLSRFEREARILASLNHPNIAGILGVEEQRGRRYLVLEFIDGETLAARLRGGALPMDEALDVGVQLARALEAAHEKGVVHRDLKPGNVMLTGDGVVKALDFGLARTVEGPASSAPRAGSAGDTPTLATPVAAQSPTIAGVVLGTAGYMSPEQARGKPVDKRSDIFSFGCVLYEMLTGGAPFAGETLSDSIGATLHKEPDWSALPRETPRRVRELLTLCLAKDRRNRLQDIGDARLTIERLGQADETEVAAHARRPVRESLAWLAALAGAGAAAWLWLSRPPAPPGASAPLARFSILAPKGGVIDSAAVNTAVSPDGRSVAFIAQVGEGPKRLWVRDLAAIAPRALEGTEGAAFPFWSPESRSLGFFASGALCRIAAQGGPVQRLADAPAGRGGSWSESGLILFAPLLNGALSVVAQSGGAPTPVTTLDASRDETGHRFPQFLPGGRTFLYASIGARNTAEWQDFTMLGSLDSKETREVCIADSRATYAPGGWLLMSRARTVYARRFDVSTGLASGEETPTGIEISGASGPSGSPDLTCAEGGVAASSVSPPSKTRCVQIGPAGELMRTLTPEPETYDRVILSPTDEFLLVWAHPLPRSGELRLIDLKGGGGTRRLLDDRKVVGAAWSPDGQWVYYSTDRASRDTYRVRAVGAGAPELVFKGTGFWAAIVTDVSADGRWAVFQSLDAKNDFDIRAFDTNTGKPVDIATGPAGERGARLSPDGRLMAYISNESGRAEAYVADFPDMRSRVRVSGAGVGAGDDPTPMRWSADGGTLLYLDGERRATLSSRVSVSPRLSAGTPEPVVQLPPGLVSVTIAPDGRSVYAIAPVESETGTTITVTTDWRQGLAPSVR